MNNFTENKTIKTLMLASILALGVNTAYANDLAPVPKVAEEHPQGTLDKLAGQPIPNTDPVQYYPTDGSAYTLTKVQEGGEKPAGDNIITKFIYNDETHSLSPVYYQLDLKQTTYGEGNSVKYYGWEKNTDTGNLEFKQDPTTPVGQTITYSYNSDSFTQKIEGQTINNPTVTNPSNPYIFNSGAGLNNPEGRTDSIDNVLYIGNKVTGTLESTTNSNKIAQVLGGAVYNAGELTSVTGLFINNSVEANSTGSYSDRAYNYAFGGALYNSGTIGDITGGFIGNYAFSTDSSAYGGAIYNNGTINDITGDFIGNYAQSSSSAAGGAIYNSGTIENIVGDFIGNYISATALYGGAIYNSGTIENIVGDFIGNYISGLNPYGGAINNKEKGTIGNITGDFIGNYVYTIDNYSLGGAIYNSDNAEIGNITGDFIGNYVRADFGNAYGGAIDNSAGYKYTATIGDITGDFIGNYASGYFSANGGAIYNRGYYAIFAEIGDIAGDFIGNYAYTSCFSANGGAIYNKYGTIGNITGDFIGNYASGNTYAEGGAIYNEYGTIGNITGDFIGNYASGNTYAEGGAIYNLSGTIGDITGDFIGNYAQSETGNALGGAIYNQGIINAIVNSDFIDNYAVSENGEAKGGAIYTTNDLTIVADNGNQIAFSGNYTESNGVKDDNAIYLDNAESTLTFKLAQGGSVYMKDNIDGAVTTDEENGTIIDAYNVDIQGDNKDNTTFYMLNDIRNADLTVDNTTLNTVNNQTHVYDFNSFTLNSDTNMVADVDLDKQTMDRFTANSYGEHNGNLHVVGMNMLSDAPDNRDITEIYFAQQGLKDNVVNGVEETPTSYQTTAYTPIYKYNVMYDNRDDAGYFLFTKGDKIFVPGGDGGTTVTPTPGGNASSAFNPSVLSSPVAAQSGAYATQNATFNYAFQHADTFMPLPAAERFALRNANKYAITGYDKLDAVDNEFRNKAIWVRPYTSFENIPLKNGPKVDTITYGTLIGGDSDFKELRNGWGTIFTGYIGYNGSSQSYSGVNTYQNGGLIGATQTFYKGNFFTALTASAGATAGESHNMYGHENFSSLMAGVANKSGYNIEFKEGKFIIQPTLMLAYSFINTFDYTNSAGVKINSDPLHAIQINPNVKFIGNLKNGWQPYASVGMVWNILDETNVTANNVRLPDMSIKPFVEYGVGVQKRWKDRCTGYLQAMIRNGGRNGIVLTGGFRWAIGKEGKPIEKVSNPQNKTAQASNNDRKILKQLSPAQRTALGAKPQNTTRTSCIGEVK